MFFSAQAKTHMLSSFDWMLMNPARLKYAINSLGVEDLLIFDGRSNGW